MENFSLKLAMLLIFLPTFGRKALGSATQVILKSPWAITQPIRPSGTRNQKASKTERGKIHYFGN
ncbi:MAG: hypothetical protein EBV05_09575 [Cyanobacteria bacterium WB6_1B_304]|nr:hypothetical protein [Cyanobacteria bacterium WB6_1B_304]